MESIVAMYLLLVAVCIGIFFSKPSTTSMGVSGEKFLKGIAVMMFVMVFFLGSSAYEHYKDTVIKCYELGGCTKKVYHDITVDHEVDLYRHKITKDK